MPKVEIELDAELYQAFLDNRSVHEKSLVASIRRDLPKQKMDFVKAMIRLKTPVVNWSDLERQIIEGSLGQRRST